MTRNNALQRFAVSCGYGMDWSYLLVVCALNVSFHYNDNATAILTDLLECHCPVSDS